MLGAVVRRFGDFAAAEDAVQEALLAAALQWPDEGVPDNPRGWLIQVAARRMTDHLRSELARRRREDDRRHAGAGRRAGRRRRPTSGDAAEQDDTLILLFMCCHPALTPSVGDRADAARRRRPDDGRDRQRVPRARSDDGAADQPREADASRRRACRSACRRAASARSGSSAVLHVLYLIFNEGYASSVGPTLQRSDLVERSDPADARGASTCCPDDGEVAGLLALMLLTDARRAARTGPDGELIPLDEAGSQRCGIAQAIAEGVALISATLSRGSIGAYQLQAAIAAVHDEAARAEDTDWPQILALYGLLKRMSDNPMVALNHAIAAAMVHGPAAGLALLEALDADPRIAGHYRLDAVRAHLLELAGDRDAAIAHYQSAAARTTSIPERNYLTTQAARLGVVVQQTEGRRQDTE